ncbi:hypothetical protein ACO11K_004058 [Bacillus cytotoxicus]|uniref:hypothetical protein n=1 Tax=Bacillus cereus group sp. BfR-BA-01492 TaxID=2920361 RepID=UPI001F58C707|nr:hypothetical protein [Bacillus cereus group sp. BfR-BA-01492]EMA6344721.1 hypothetical protein [Bacillus cytotoxicus]
MKNKRKSMMVITLFIIIYVILHSTPNVTIRTTMFLSGHPKIAVQGDVQKRANLYEEAIPKSLRVLYGEEKDEYDSYHVFPSKKKEEEEAFGCVYVKKVWMLYSAEFKRL